MKVKAGRVGKRFVRSRVGLQYLGETMTTTRRQDRRSSHPQENNN